MTDSDGRALMGDGGSDHALYVAERTGERLGDVRYRPTSAALLRIFGSVQSSRQRRPLLGL